MKQKGTVQVFVVATHLRCALKSHVGEKEALIILQLGAHLKSDLVLHHLIRNDHQHHPRGLIDHDDVAHQANPATNTTAPASPTANR